MGKGYAYQSMAFDKNILFNILNDCPYQSLCTIWAVWPWHYSWGHGSHYKYGLGIFELMHKQVIKLF